MVCSVVPDLDVIGLLPAAAAFVVLRTLQGFHSPRERRSDR